jgi:hypothetical protein
MNVPPTLRKLMAGFIIPPRTYSHLLFSAAKGAFSLISEPNRVKFIEMLENGTIKESVLAQATFGPARMLSLFYELKNPLFKQTTFSTSEFLEGVGPALKNFHSVGGAVENELQDVMNEAANSDEDDNNMETRGGEELGKDDSSIGDPGIPGKENEALLTTMQLFEVKNSVKMSMSIMERSWTEIAAQDPDSLPGQLQRMVTNEVFHSHEASAKASFLFHDISQKVTFHEGSCKVTNVALLGARALAFKEVATSAESDDVGGDIRTGPGPHYEAIDYDVGEGKSDSQISIAAQLEVLYDVTLGYTVEDSVITAKKFFVNKDDGQQDKDTLSSSDDNAKPDLRHTTLVSVATLEGWLKGGPDNHLRWKLALNRPAYEFPAIQHSF